MNQANNDLEYAREIRRLRDIIDRNSDWIWEVDANGRYTFCSQHCQALLGRMPGEILGHTPFEFMPTEEADRVGAVFADILARRAPFSGLVNRNLRADGQELLLETSGIPLFDEQGAFIGYRGIDRDITPGHGQLSTRTEPLDRLYVGAPVALCLIDPEKRVIASSKVFCQVLGLAEQSIEGQPLERVLPKQSLDIGRCLRSIERNGAMPPFEMEWQGRCYHVTVQGVRSPGAALIGVSLAFTDITEQRRMRHQLSQMNQRLEQANARLRESAERDFLTGLPNRRRFDELLTRELGRAMRDGRPLALIMIDVDHFKSYNDRYGHLAGDDCLRNVARTLQQSLQRPGDLVFRYGGEEFAALLADTPADAATGLAERLREGIQARAVEHGASPLGYLTISAGVGALSVTPGAARGRGDTRASTRALIRAADDSLYAAKSQGRNRVCAAVADTVFQGKQDDPRG